MPEPKIKQLALKNITVDPALQMRANGSNPVTVDEFAAAMLAGDEFPPLAVFHDAGGTMWLADGFTRHAAATKADLKTHAAAIRSGTRKDAVIYSAGANRTNGVRMTNADKRCAVSQLLAEFEDMPNTQIADIVGVSDTLVAAVKKRLQRIKDGLPVKRIGSGLSDDGEPKQESPEDEEPEVTIAHASAGKAADVFGSVLKRLKRIQEDISGLLTGDFSQQIKNLSESYTGCKWYDSGETIQLTFHGGTTIGIPRFSNDSLDFLLGFCGGAKQMLERIDEKTLGGADEGERSAPWDKADFDAKLRSPDDTVQI